jgi:predicted DNA-binding helix-hairpin-helix protein
MQTLEKTRILGDAGRYDSCGPKGCEVKIDKGLGGIYHAKAEHKTCRLFKTLMDNSCSFDCKYCGNAKGCTKTKASYEPKELAGLFNSLHKKLDVEGLFLSSGVSGNPDRVTEKMVEAVKILRVKYSFKGYVHFKILPGTSYELVKQASELSTRMSINIEAPNKGVLSELSSCKDYKIDILRRQAWISRLCKNQTTQMMVNSFCTDKDVLKMTRWEYEKIGLKRMYFSAFRPVKGTPLEKEKAEPMTRQNHLYNVDFLVRHYGYGFKEFDEVMNNGMLPNEDPKRALARAKFENGLDVNDASYEDLIKVPGIGLKTAKKIVTERKNTKLEKPRHLQNAGIILKRARPFLKINGYRQKMLGEF